MSEVPPTRIEKHSLLVAGHRTSISLERAFWRALVSAAQEDAVSVTALVSRIDAARDGNLSGAIRVFLLQRALADAG